MDKRDVCFVNQDARRCNNAQENALMIDRRLCWKGAGGAVRRVK